jgi:hypothetical protein
MQDDLIGKSLSLVVRVQTSWEQISIVYPNHIEGRPCLLCCATDIGLDLCARPFTDARDARSSLFSVQQLDPFLTPAILPAAIVVIIGKFVLVFSFCLAFKLE